MNIKDLENYADAWNNHDIDTIMSYMTPDCIFETGGGKESFGTRYEGFETVKQRFIDVWTEIPDVKFLNVRHFLQEDRGCSQWTTTGTRADGSKMEIDGCDLFDFENGKIKIKNSLIKLKK